MVSKKEILSAVALIVFVGFFSASKFGAFDSPSPCESLSPEMKFLNDEFHVLLGKKKIIMMESLIKGYEDKDSYGRKTESWIKKEWGIITKVFTFQGDKVSDVKYYFLGETNSKALEYKDTLIKVFGMGSNNELYPYIWDVEGNSKKFHIVLRTTFEEDWEGFVLWVGNRAY